MTKAKVILVACFLLIFAAGASLGLFASGASLSVLLPGRDRPAPPEWWERELNLTAEQKQRMRKIWEPIKPPAPEGDRRSGPGEQRDKDIAALFSEPQRAQYQGIRDKYARQMDEQSQEMRRKFEQAAEQARKAREQEVMALLSAEQRTRYDAIQENYRRQWEEQSQRMRQQFERFQQAVEQTKAILTPEQRAKYEELLTRPRDRRPGGTPLPGFRGPSRYHGWPSSRPDGRPTSRPAAGERFIPRSGG